MLCLGQKISFPSYRRNVGEINDQLIDLNGWSQYSLCGNMRGLVGVVSQSVSAGDLLSECGLQSIRSRKSIGLGVWSEDSLMLRALVFTSKLRATMSDRLLVLDGAQFNVTTSNTLGLLGTTEGYTLVVDSVIAMTPVRGSIEPSVAENLLQARPVYSSTKHTHHLHGVLEVTT